MVIIQALLAYVARSAGKILNTAFGWATVMLFGQVPQERQIYLSIIAFGSLAWVVARAGGLETEPRPASWMLRMPTKFLALFARSAVAPLVADFLTTLVAPSIEVLVHPSDIVIMGRDFDAVRARAILAEHLTYTKAYLTWTKEANQIEERLGALWRSPTSVASAQRQLAEIHGQLRSLKLSYEEWEILFRQRLLVDRQLSGAAPLMSPEAPPPAESTPRASSRP